MVPGTATTMVKALADAGLLEYAPRVGVQLTAHGRKLALHVLRRHRLIEQFLVEVLGFDWSELHAEAECLEHEVSDLLLERNLSAESLCLGGGATGQNLSLGLGAAAKVLVRRS